MPLRRRAFAPALLLCLLTGCTPTVATRGNLVEEARLSEVRPGLSTRDDVTQILGTPTAVATFDADRWYYIGQKTEQTAFFRPEVTERRVVTVSFDPAGRVAEVRELDLADARDVDMVDRITPTEGRDLGFFEQILGNVGRFRPPQ